MTSQKAIAVFMKMNIGICAGILFAGSPLAYAANVPLNCSNVQTGANLFSLDVDSLILNGESPTDSIALQVAGTTMACSVDVHEIHCSGRAGSTVGNGSKTRVLHLNIGARSTTQGKAIGDGYLGLDKEAVNVVCIQP